MHLGIIMDGNRRWAKEKSLPSFTGHIKGAENVKNVIRWCAKRDIEFLTLFAFSMENWQRAEKEVNFLLKFGKNFVDKNIEEFHREGGRVRVLGSRERLPLSLIERIEKAEKLTRENNRITVNLLFNYGGRAEIAAAVKNIIKDGIPSEEINEEKISQYLYTTGLPDPDLIIRTSGEQRTSGFLLWQSAYSELYFIEKYWPDFSEQDLDEALAEYGRRQRRFGK